MSKDSLRKIMSAGKEKGFDIRLCHEELYGDSMGKANSYLEMIAHNVEIIARELKNNKKSPALKIHQLSVNYEKPLCSGIFLLKFRKAS